MKNSYKIFISSPSDVKNERDIIENVIKSFSIEKGIDLIPIRWEKDLPTTSGKRAQNVINEELLNQCDLLVGLFCTRFGSPTQEYESGTAEEIEKFINMDRKVILYFLDKSITPSEIDPEELRKIKEFQEKYKEKGIYKRLKVEGLEEALKKDLAYNINKLQEEDTNTGANYNKNDSENGEDGKQKNQEGNWWSDESITAYINEFLRSKQFFSEYEGHITFYENTQKLKNAGPFTESTIISLLNQAKAYAFNKKYGDFDYSKDIRSIFKTWSEKILEKVLEYKNLDENIRVIGVGSNDGSELLEIFNGNDKVSLTVLDISKDAIDKGKEKYKNLSFVEGDMESDYPIVEKFDICLCLRAIQSRGIFRQNALLKMDRCLKKSGLIVISIPNGYIDAKNNNEIVRGLYDQRNKIVHIRRPQALANKVLNKLIDYGYVSTGTETLSTEILIWGTKNND